MALYRFLFAPVLLAVAVAAGVPDGGESKAPPAPPAAVRAAPPAAADPVAPAAPRVARKDPTIRPAPREVAPR